MQLYSVWIVEIVAVSKQLIICNRMSGEMHPEKLVSFLNDIFSSFDNLLHEYGLEKIKTIGDAYMFAGGLSKSPTVHTKHGTFTAAEAVAGI